MWLLGVGGLNAKNCGLGLCERVQSRGRNHSGYWTWAVYCRELK